MNDKPLYLYKLDETTGKVGVTKITKYEQGKWANRRPYWRFKIGGATYYCYQSDLDRVKNWRLYSFFADKEKATRLFMADIKTRQYKAFLEYNRYCEVMQKMGVEI